MDIRTKNVSTLTVLLAFGLGLGGASVHASSQVGLALYNAAGDGDVDTVCSILATEVGKSQINRKWQWNRVNPLLEAVRGGHDAVVRVLLERGADVHVSSYGQETPLHIAADKGHKAIVSLLLEHGADVHVLNSSQKTPLHIAACEGHKAIVNLLLEHGADTEAKDNFGGTPLLIMCDADTGVLRPLDQYLEQLNKERLQAVRVWSEQLQQNCGLPKVVVNQIILPMALTDNQRRRFENLARTPDRTGNPRPRKRARGL